MSMHCKVLVAVDARNKLVGLAVTGLHLEVEEDFALAESGCHWGDILPSFSRAKLRSPGLYVWEGQVGVDEDGACCDDGQYRVLTPEERALVAQGNLQLWPRGPNRHSNVKEQTTGDVA